MSNSDKTKPLSPLASEPENARRKSTIAHKVVSKLKEMGLPEDFDKDLAVLSTTIGDLWDSQKQISALLESILESSNDWNKTGDNLVDLISSLDHMNWHIENSNLSINKLAEFAYIQSSDIKSKDTE